MNGGGGGCLHVQKQEKYRGVAQSSGNYGVEGNTLRWYQHANVITWIMHNPPCPNIINWCAISVYARLPTRAQMVIYVAAELSRDNYSYSYAEINWERCGR